MTAFVLKRSDFLVIFIIVIYTTKQTQCRVFKSVNGINGDENGLNKQRLINGLCSVRVNEDLPEPEPLILLGQPKAYSLLQPTDKTGLLTLQPNEEITLSCLGNGNVLNVSTESHPSQKVNNYIISCSDKKQFTVEEGKSHTESIEDLHCKSYSSATLKTNSETCGNNDNFKKFQIGFEVGNFAALFEGCFNLELHQPLYSHYPVSKAIKDEDTGIARPSFRDGGLYDDVAINSLYSAGSQSKMLSELLGPEMANKYIDRDNDFYLARGHLAAKADFTLANYQRATFFYENAAPQWQVFNGGNWEVVESNTRKYVGDMELDVEVYTGTLGVSTLEDESGNDVELYLDGTARTVVIPKFYWKLIYSDSLSKGTVFIGINEPYRREMTPEEYLCDDVCDDISWAPSDRNNFTLGIVYCCKVGDFIRNVPYVDDVRFQRDIPLLI